MRGSRDEGMVEEEEGGGRGGGGGGGGREVVESVVESERGCIVTTEKVKVGWTTVNDGGQQGPCQWQ